MKDARVVHENVHGSEELDSPGAGGARAIDRPQVCLNLDAPATLAGDRLPRRLQALCVSPTMATSAPASAKTVAISAPIPREAPVTRALLS